MQYTQQAKRNMELSNHDSTEEYLSGLNIKISYGVNRASEINRISQLINKTNQFNLTTKRYSESEVSKIMENNYVYDFSVKDRFGDMGIVGVVIVINKNIDTFLLSCRALGRNIEDDILNVIINEFSPSEITSSYIPSKSNELTKDFYSRNKFMLISNNHNHSKYVLKSRCSDSKSNYTIVRY